MSAVSIGAAFRDPIIDAEAWTAAMVERCIREDCGGMFVSRPERQEAAQDVLELLVQLERGFDADRGVSFAGYAASVVRLRLIDYIPRRLLGRNGERIAERNAVGASKVAEGLESPDHADDAASRLDYLAAVRRLEPNDRRVAHLLAEGRSYREIATDLDVSKRAVEASVARMRERLADLAA